MPEGLFRSLRRDERMVYFGPVLGPAPTGQGGAILAAAKLRSRPGAGSGVCTTHKVSIGLTTPCGPRLRTCEKPAINEDGELRLLGYLTIQPAPPIFRLRLVYEHPDWKLIGANVRM